MGDETAPTVGKEPWFVVRWRKLLDVLMYDEDATRRWIGLWLLGIGGTILGYGQIPGTDIVVPGVKEWIPTEFGTGLAGIAAWMLGRGSGTVKKEDS